MYIYIYILYKFFFNETFLIPAARHSWKLDAQWRPSGLSGATVTIPTGERTEGKERRRGKS